VLPSSCVEITLKLFTAILGLPSKITRICSSFCLSFNPRIARRTSSLFTWNFTVVLALPRLIILDLKRVMLVQESFLDSL